MEDGSLNMAQQWISLKDPEIHFRNYDIWFKQMSYFRVNSIRLGYTFASDIAKKLRLLLPPSLTSLDDLRFHDHLLGLEG